MTDADKVIKALERCQVCDMSPISIGEGRKAYLECEYTIGMYCGKDKLIYKTISVLKDQERLINKLTGIIDRLNKHIDDIGKYMTPNGMVIDVKAVTEMINKAEAIVPCKYCGCFRPDGYCEHHHMTVKEDFYCADGYK